MGIFDNWKKDSTQEPTQLASGPKAVVGNFEGIHPVEAMAAQDQPIDETEEVDLFTTESNIAFGLTCEDNDKEKLNVQDITYSI